MTQPSYDFTPISGPPGGIVVWMAGINNSGQILGSAEFNTSVGFTYDGGNYAIFSIPGFGNVSGINDQGQIVGYGSTGFIYNLYTETSTYFSPLNAYPGATEANGINDIGQAVGSYVPLLSGGIPGDRVGFLYNGGGTYTTIDDPLSQGTWANGINNVGQIVGFYGNNSGNHGFLDSGGTYTTLDDPLATDGTFATGINDSGQIVGYYVTARPPSTTPSSSLPAFQEHGFFYSNGNYVTIDDPAGTDTILTGINDAGQIIGNYALVNANGTPSWHGFLATVAFTAETAGNTVYTAEYATAPNATELNILVQFTNPQYAYAQQIGVTDPAIYAYEALGVALASTANHFQNTFGPSVPAYPASPSGDAQFATDAYASVFGHSGSSAQVQQFVDQLTYFENLYTAAGVFGSASNIVLLARGAVYGQMLGIEHEIDPTTLGDPAGASIVGINPIMTHSV